jgi:hypothetical protein
MSEFDLIEYGYYKNNRTRPDSLYLYLKDNNKEVLIFLYSIRDKIGSNLIRANNNFIDKVLNDLLNAITPNIE